MLFEPEPGEIEALAVPGGIAAGRLVEVAVDAPGGPGPRTWTYAVPAGLADLEPGEAVLVPFGKGARQALGIVIADVDGATVPPGSPEARPIAARVRTDGPLLPPLALGLAVGLASHYLAPVATVVRAMVPPGLLERLELVVEVAPAGEAALALPEPGLSPADVDLLDEVAGRSRPVRVLSTPEGRGSLLRRLRFLADEGLVDLGWTLVGATTGPRYERRLWLTTDGVEAASAMRIGDRLPGRPLGPRQLEALASLATEPSAAPVGGTEGLAAASLAEGFGAASLAGLVRRGLARTVVR